jgi:hypothetical protein
MKVLRRLLFVAALTLIAAQPFGARADEGFWPFNAVPREAIKAAHGFEVTDAWLEHLQLSAVRFGGASGSFISADGLVLTNHHVGLSTIQKLSTPDRDLVKNGFYAPTLADELKAPDLELSVLASMEDVTTAVNAAVTPRMSAAEALVARRAAIANLEKTSLARTGLQSDVVTLYQGARYHLYRYKKYTDVRLVFAPEFGTAFYGGDTDNFTYPRYCLDVSMFRVYVDGKPAQVQHWLRWAPMGSKENDLVFSSGHPGATQRLNTVAHLQYLRDTGLPWSIKSLELRHAALKAYAATGAEQARQAGDEIFGIENSLKSMRGQLKGLQDASVMQGKQAAETRLRDTVAKNATLQADYATAWDAVAAARQSLARTYKEQAFIDGTSGLNTRLFSYARTIVRLAAERAKPDQDRLAEFTDARLPAVERSLNSPAPVYLPMEKTKLAGSLAFMATELGPTHPFVMQVLDGRTPERRAAALIEGTTLANVAARKALVAGGIEAVNASTDPMIVLARTIDAQARATRKQVEDQVTSVERASYAKIAQAVFAVDGPKAYPDATSTLRLAYGTVTGYKENGRTVAPYTQIKGLYDRGKEHKQQPPYRITESWMRAQPTINGDVPFNFVSTLDIVGGNSGSPVVNRDGQLVGLIFDGNIQSLPGYFVYDQPVNRAVAVDARAIIEALRKVYGTKRIVDEILGREMTSR